MRKDRRAARRSRRQDWKSLGDADRGDAGPTVLMTELVDLSRPPRGIRRCRSGVAARGAIVPEKPAEIVAARSVALG
jgi:hypothetical protein